MRADVGNRMAPRAPFLSVARAQSITECHYYGIPRSIVPARRLAQSNELLSILSGISKVSNRQGNRRTNQSKEIRYIAKISEEASANPVDSFHRRGHSRSSWKLLLVLFYDHDEPAAQKQLDALFFCWFLRQHYSLLESYINVYQQLSRRFGLLENSSAHLAENSATAPLLLSFVTRLKPQSVCCVRCDVLCFEG